MYDVVIVGGGPAGSTLARIIGARYKVLLLEKRSFAEPLSQKEQKCCGGLLDPDAQKMLAVLGLGLPKEIVVSPQVFAVRTIDSDNAVERYYQRHYVNIDRERFDRWLLSIVPHPVEKVFGCRYSSHEEYPEHLKVSYLKGDSRIEVKTRLLIGADGAASRVRSLAVAPDRAPQKYLAIQEWFETSRATDYYCALFDREITDYYSWIIPKESCLIVGSALQPRQRVAERFEQLKRKMEMYGFQLGKSLQKNSALLFRPTSTKQIVLGRGRIGLVGEAAGFVSPSSGEGISYALKSALALGESLFLDFDRWLRHYAQKTQGLKNNIWLKNLKSPFMYNRPLRRLVMKSGLGSIRVRPQPAEADLPARIPMKP